MIKDVATKKMLQKFGLKIRALREENGWTLEDAEEHGFPNFQHLGTVEAGKKNINFTTISNLSKLYKISISELFKGI